jgi:hypothetical protein
VTGRHAATAEQGPPEIGAATAGAADHPTRWTIQRAQAGADDSRLVQDLQRASFTRDVELIPGLGAEGAPPIAPDLALHPEPPQERERPPSDPGGREIEVERDFAATA